MTVSKISGLAILSCILLTFFASSLYAFEDIGAGKEGYRDFNKDEVKVDKADSSVELSLGASVIASTSVYKDYGTSWDLWPMINLESKWFYIRGFDAGIKLYDSDTIEFSAFLGYDDTSFQAKDSNNSQLRMLENRNTSAIAGLQADITTPIGQITLRGARDILGKSEGFSGEVSFVTQFDVGKLSFYPGAGVYWADSKYNDYYFGVSHKESNKSGLKYYKPDFDVTPFINLGASYEINDKWDVFCKSELTLPGNEIKDSPMANSSTTQEYTFGIMYSF